MKKLYLFLCMVLCIATVSKAQRTYTIHLTVTDPSCITVKACDYADKEKVLETFEMKEGENTIEFTSPSEGSHLWITCDPDKVLKIHNEDGSVNYDVSNNAFKLYLSPYDSWWADPAEQWYTVKTFDADTFRSHNVKVTIDNPEGLRLELRGNTAFNPDKTEYIIPFNEEYEDLLSVRCIDADNIIYKITADGNEVKRAQSDYPIALVDRSDADDIKYISEVVIIQDFPEDITANIKIIFTNGDPNCVKSITYNNEVITDFASEDGFIVKPGKKLEIDFNTEDYRILSYQKDDQEPNQSTYINGTSQVIDKDFTLKVTAEKYKELTAILVVDDPEAVRATRGSYPNTIEYELVAGDNEIPFTDKSWANELKVEPRDGYELIKIYDATNDKEISLSTWSTYTTIYLEDQVRYEVTTSKIYRDKQFVVYVDDVSSLWDDYVSVSRGGSSLKTQLGYNVFDYRDEDGKISFSASGASTQSTKYYRNDDLIEIDYASYFTILDPSDNDVIKLFFNTDNAIEHTVTFEMNEGALEGYEVKKDILAPVFPEFPVPAIGKTLFTITPVDGSADTNLTITVGDETIEPVDGVYSFETEADTTVKVSGETTGIENVNGNEIETSDVYNLQGIRVARQANATDVNALPAGIYVVKGQKVLVK